MPPGNICAVVCNSKEKEENVNSFTLPKTNTDPVIVAKERNNTETVSQPKAQETNGTVVASLSAREPSSVNTQESTDPSVTSSNIGTVTVITTKAQVNNETEALVIQESEQSDAYDSETGEVSFNKMPLQLTKPAPQFKATAVVNGEFKDISLADFKGKYVVLFFYPLDFTFVCPTEIIAFSERADDFRKVGCEVIAASTDSHFTHLAWINTPRKQGGLGPMQIPIISDKSHRIARDYGILDEETGIPFRGLFIIDGKQNLRQITVNDLPVGRSVEETLRLVQAFQFTDKHGEVCPANWTPGSKTIKPDTKAAKEYFGDAN